MPARHAIVAAVAAAGLAMLVGGCELLAAGGAFGPDFEGAFPSSSSIATYSHGKATIAITGGETIVLDQLAKGAGVDTLFGSDVRWTGSSGWNLRVTGAGANNDFGGVGAVFDGGYVTFDRIADGQHWTSFDGNRCVVAAAVVTADAFKGTASCKGIEWFDALDMSMTVNGPQPIDQPKFDAEVTFEATR